MPIFESNMEAPPLPNNRPDRSRKDTCGKHRGKYRGEATPKLGTANVEHNPRPPQTPQESGSEIPLQKLRKIGANPCQNSGLPKHPPPHDTRNAHDPKTSPLPNTTKKRGKPCPNLDQRRNKNLPRCHQPSVRPGLHNLTSSKQNHGKRN